MHLWAISARGLFITITVHFKALCLLKYLRSNHLVSIKKPLNDIKWDDAEIKMESLQIWVLLKHFRSTFRGFSKYYDLEMWYRATPTFKTAILFLFFNTQLFCNCVPLGFYVCTFCFDDARTNGNYCSAGKHGIHLASNVSLFCCYGRNCGPSLRKMTGVQSVAMRPFPLEFGII